MSPTVLLATTKTRAFRASRQLVTTSWQASSTLLDIALRMMAASLVAAMLLMAVACAMHAITLTLSRIDAAQVKPRRNEVS